MEGIHTCLTMTLFFSFLLLILPQTSAQDICSPPTDPVEFPENNKVNDVVVTIDVQPGVTLAFKPPPANPNNPFILNGTQLLASTVIDYEATKSYIIAMNCIASTGLLLPFNVIVIVTNENDNPPVFDEEVYHVNISEFSPKNTVVGSFSARDADGGQLFYRLEPASSNFTLRSPTNPTILVQTPLDFDKVKEVQLRLTAQDTPLEPASSKVPHKASTTIIVNIVDVDNRPPWFHPCNRHEIGGILICQSPGYTGRIVLNKLQSGALSLEPGPLYAVDGDSGINEEITYSILSGNSDNLFEINPDSGNITMQKAASKLEPIVLTVLATQKTNTHQFATATVTFSVLEESDHRPRFQKPRYEGIITEVGQMAMDQKNKDEPLQILALDDDYVGTGGINPYITYYVNGSSDFTIINGFLFMTKAVSDGVIPLQVVAEDTSNKESATAQLFVEVKGLTTTSVPLSTTDSKTTVFPGGSTTSGKTTEDTVATKSPSTSKPSTTSNSGISTSIPILTTSNPSTSSVNTALTTTPTIITTKPTDSSALTTKPTITTTKPSIPTDSSTLTTKPTITTTKPSIPTDSSALTNKPTITTTNPSISTDNSLMTSSSSKTTEGIVATTSPSMTTEGTISTVESSIGTGSFSTNNGPSTTSEGATAHTVVQPPGLYGPADMAALGATLGVLLFICLVILGVFIFRTRRENGDWKKIYETNVFRSSMGQGIGSQKEGIQYTNDAFQNDEDGDSTGSSGPDKKSPMAIDKPKKVVYETVMKPSELLHNDNTSQAGSDRGNSEKEVKPILTKERRVDEGYKSVWFKEDIDPDAKEEVVIIPDSRENDSEEEGEEQTLSGRDEDDEDNLPRVAFNVSDMDSGLRPMIKDPAEDSEYEVKNEMLTAHL